MPLALVILTNDGTPVFLHTRSYITISSTLSICKELMTKIKFSEAKSKPKGSFLLLEQFITHYNILNEVLVVVIQDKDDNPFSVAPVMTRATNVLTSACKGTDVSHLQLKARQVHVHFALERVLSGDEGIDLLTTTKIQDISPHGGVWKTQKGSFTSSLLLEFSNATEWPQMKARFLEEQRKLDQINKINTTISSSTETITPTPKLSFSPNFLQLETKDWAALSPRGSRRKGD